MCPKDADGMANSVDSEDQAAPLGSVWSGSTLFAWSRSTLFAQTYLSKSLGSLRLISGNDAGLIEILLYQKSYLQNGTVCVYRDKDWQNESIQFVLKFII